VTENILKVRKTGFTLVPEAGRTDSGGHQQTTRQSGYPGRRGHGIRKGLELLKLYFMIGLPTENQEDLKGSFGWSRRSTGWEEPDEDRAPDQHQSFFLHPNAAHPFPMASHEEEGRSRKTAIHPFAAGPVPVDRDQTPPTRSSLLEAVFSRGDRKLAGVVELEARRPFDSWKDRFDSLAGPRRSLPRD